MALLGSRLCIVAFMALATAACQDTGPQPRFISNSDGGGQPVVAPSSAAREIKTADASQSQGYFIEFRSRYALSYGHTYVVFGRSTPSGEMINPQVAGLHPASDSETPYVLGHFLPVKADTGWSDGDLEEQYRSASWRVMLSEAEYQQIVANIRKMQASSPMWHAALYNCNAFVADIARSIGYKTPAIQIRPQQFVTKLREMNADRKIVVRAPTITSAG